MRHRPPRIKGCYYCGKPPTSHEHVPPRMMFKGFDCDSITVPACADHNNEKSGRDQTIVFGHLLYLQKPNPKHPLELEVQMAVDIASPAFPQLRKRVSL